MTNLVQGIHGNMVPKSKKPEVSPETKRIAMTPKISPGNTKLGKIPSFSIPSRDTCPGRTSACSTVCYAAKIERIYPTVKAAYAYNLSVTKDKAFVADMIKAITGKPVFRIHVSGDFYSAKYVSLWARIVEACPNTMFYAYTRSWRVPGLVKALDALRMNRNILILASIDEETGPAPTGWRSASMGIQTFQAKPVPCPQQTKKALSCEACKICFNIKTSANIQFSLH